MNTIPSPVTIPNMKPPHASSVPHLLNIDPLAPFEFYFPSQDMWWDLSDMSSSEPEDEDLSESDLNVSFTSSFYQFFHDCWCSLIHSAYFTSCSVYISIFHEQPGHYFYYSLVHADWVEFAIN